MADDLFVSKEEQDKAASKVLGKKPDDPAKDQDRQDNLFIKDSATITSPNPPKMESLPQHDQQNVFFANNSILTVVGSGNVPTPEHIVDVCDKVMSAIKPCAQYDIPEIVSIRMDNIASNTGKLLDMIRQQFSKRIEAINQAPNSKENEAELNQINKALNSLYRLQGFLVKHADHFKLLLSTINKLQRCLEEERQLVERILHVANAKKYNIYELDGSAKMEEDDGAQAFMVNDAKQSKLITQMKEQFNQLIASLNQISADFAETLGNEMDDKAQKIRSAADQKLKDTRKELAFFEQKFIKKIMDKKMQDKLKAEMTVFSYLLKHPLSLSKGRLADIRDAVNKIKWQMIPFQRS